MRTRRESIQAPAVSSQLVGLGTLAGEPVLPSQQQRAMAQLRTAMLNLNKKHGSSTTNEVLNQIIGALAFADDEHKVANVKPEYSDVVCDTELSVPPLPENPSVPTATTRVLTLKPLPQWFSFDEVSAPEKKYFGPLFSMDEERWKIYLSLRNDVVRIYEDMLAQTQAKASVYMSSTDLRQRLHPKDDAAYIFEMWKLLTQIGVINRGRVDEIAIQTAKGDGVTSASEITVPPKSVSRKTNIPANLHSAINCSACGRECKFFCYKPLQPPPETPEAVVAPLTATEEEMNPEDSQEIKEEPSVVSYMCHDCTPAFFEKIPLRLFIDQETKERIVRGEFEEVSKDDLKSFLVVPNDSRDGLKSEGMNEKKESAPEFRRLMTKLTAGSKKGIVKGWEGYEVSGTEGMQSQQANPLEILDPTMQEALSGAGQKIRGSVLIEQQVRNMVYGASLHNDEIEPVCPTTVERAHLLVEEIFKRVAKKIDQPLPPHVISSPVFVTAKKTDPVHFEMLSMIWRAGQAAREGKEELLAKVEGAKIEAIAKERISAKTQYIQHLRSFPMDTEMDQGGPVAHVGDLFRTVKIDNSVRLASTNPKQLRLVSL
jgi:hypothetical protein